MSATYDTTERPLATGSPSGPEYVRYADGNWYPVPPPASCAPQAGPPAAPARPSHRRRAVVLSLTAALALMAILLAAVLGIRPSSSAAPATTALPALTAPAHSGSAGAAITPAAAAAGLSEAGRAAAATVSPALVDINTAVGYDGAQAAGTGIVLTSDGRVLTNHHVIAGATQMSVTDVGNGQTYQAQVVGYDSSKDVAVLQLVGASGLATAQLADPVAVAVGDTVVGVGNAGGVGARRFRPRAG